MRLAVIGSRSFSNYDLMCHTLNTHFLEEGVGYWFSEIVSGGAVGADSLARRWVEEYGSKEDVSLLEIKPDWENLGRAAGVLRNKDIVDKADFVLAFWDATSKGTSNSLAIAKKIKKHSLIIYF